MIVPQPVVRGPQIWPLGVKACNVLGELGLVPEKTELLNGQILHEHKLRAYVSVGVKECWLVLGPEKQIEVHRQQQGGQFAEHVGHGPSGTLTSAAVPGFTVEWDRLFAA